MKLLSRALAVAFVLSFAAASISAVQAARLAGIAAQTIVPVAGKSTCVKSAIKFQANRCPGR
jgi:hypothetical protein